MIETVHIILVSILFFACQNDDMSNTQNEVVLESVVGKLSSPSHRAIPNTIVFYDNYGTMYTTKTDQSGNFELRFQLV